MTTVEVPQQMAARTRWLALVVLVLAAFMTTLDDFIVFVAEPALQRELHMDAAGLQWVIAGYVLAYGVLVVTGGRLGDIYGRKRLFLYGVWGFTLTSFLCGIAPDTLVLIIARILEGITAALMFPQVFSLLKVTFPEKEQGIALGIIGAVLGAAAIGGQLLGGLLLGANIGGLGWRPIFFVNVPVGLLAALAAPFLLRESRSTTATRVDGPGVLLATGTLFLLAFPLVEGREMGWPWWTLLCLVACLPVGWLFLRYEQRRTRMLGSPLLDLSLFRNTVFTRSILILLLETALGSAFFFILALYLQSGHHFSPFEAGLAFTPMAIAYTVGSLATSRLTPKLGTRILHLGILIAALGTVVTFVVVSMTTKPTLLTMLPLAILGFGNALVATPLPGFILTVAGDDAAGAASGSISTAQQVGPALGIAVIGVIFFSLLGEQHYTTAFSITMLCYILGICMLQMALALGLPRLLHEQA
uniref:MFS transporter n=1 Tax=Thermosporothrix sp. COM3 TaxID=2490863 RepID=A0A455SP80_9CHLR|nr:MFS transporter [Thermosporothrix sp. COM3]